MRTLRNPLVWFVASVLVSVALPIPVWTQTDSGATKPHQRAAVEGDSQHDFDFEFGTWQVHLRRLLQPLTSSDTWVEYEGVSIVEPIWNGRANLGTIEVDGPAGHIQGLSLRLYNPESRQWNISWANSNDGTLGPPMIGGFENGRGEFYNQETLNGRAIYVRFIFSNITQDSFRFEQAFSDDGGETWEPNWIATFARVSDKVEDQSKSQAAIKEDQETPREQKGQPDWDFNLGTWKTHVSRLPHPLTDSTTWLEYEGTSIVRDVWDGRASLIELAIDGPAGRIEGLGLRLYNPRSQQWSLNWANSEDGVMTPPVIGEFKNGRGEFFGQESVNGRSILVRNVFFHITPNSSRFEQAYSDDGGKTWQANWVMTFTRRRHTDGRLSPQKLRPSAASSRVR